MHEEEVGFIDNYSSKPARALEVDNVSVEAVCICALNGRQNHFGSLGTYGGGVPGSAA